jgi:DNA invertase Pin-like site-specific DNA recombinase
MADASSRKLDVVLVWKLDRFARSLKHLINALAEFESLGITFVSLRDHLDLGTASGRLMFQIVGAMAEFERTLTVERVRAGLQNAVAKGKTLGRPRREIDLGKVAYLREEGRSWREIGKMLNIDPTLLCRTFTRNEGPRITTASGEPSKRRK